MPRPTRTLRPPAMTLPRTTPSPDGTEPDGTEPDGKQADTDVDETDVDETAMPVFHRMWSSPTPGGDD